MLVVAPAGHTFEKPLIWSCSLSSFPVGDGEEESALLRPLYSGVYAKCARLPCQRVVVDSLLSSDEIAYYLDEDSKNIYGDPIFDEEETGYNKCIAARVDWADDPLHDRICSRLCEQICCHFGED